MDEILPYYEQELGFLRRYSREFSEKYPKIAGRLLLSGETSEDPHIERLIQSFALLNARTAKRLDDDYPEFTEALLEVLYPHYLRPFPSCSIVRMEPVNNAAQSGISFVIPRGTELTTRPVKNVPCKFKTVFDVSLRPLQVNSASFSTLMNSPDTANLPPQATSRISITLETAAETFSHQDADVRVFIDGEPSLCAALRDALFMHNVKAYVENSSSPAWHPLPVVPIIEVGFAEKDALLDFPARSHPSYRFLTEYFAFPEKFNFFDISIPACASVFQTPTKLLTLHLVLENVRIDSSIGRLLNSLSAKNLVLGCTPVINLFKQKGDPIRLTHTTTHYSVVPDSRRAYAYEVYSIDQVSLVRQTLEGESVTEFRPFYSLRHGDAALQGTHYWIKRRNNALVGKSLGYETEITLVDSDFDPANGSKETLSLNLTCTNRDLPVMLSYGMPGGDVFLEGGSVVRSITLLRKPTSPLRFESERGVHWRLISHLALNHFSLTEGGLDALKETLRLYDLPNSAVSQRQIDSVVGIAHKSDIAWLPGNPFSTLVRGLEIKLTIDEEGFVGNGIHTFISVLERFLALYVHANSFVRLVVISKRTGEEVLRCPARNGECSLA